VVKINGTSGNAYNPAGQSGSYTVSVSNTCGIFISSPFLIVSTKESMNDAGIKVFPNPALGMLFIESSMNIPLLFALYSIQGKHIMTKDLAGKQVYSIELNNIEPRNVFLYFTLRGKAGNK
jgi:hypothetical protein